jgi:hypothetical protein
MQSNEEVRSQIAQANQAKAVLLKHLAILLLQSDF